MPNVFTYTGIMQKAIRADHEELKIAKIRPAFIFN